MCESFLLLRIILREFVCVVRRGWFSSALVLTCGRKCVAFVFLEIVCEVEVGYSIVSFTRLSTKPFIPSVLSQRQFSRSQHASLHPALPVQSDMLRALERASRRHRREAGVIWRRVQHVPEQMRVVSGYSHSAHCQTNSSHCSLLNTVLPQRNPLMFSDAYATPARNLR